LAYGTYFKASSCWWINNLDEAIKSFSYVINQKHYSNYLMAVDSYIAKALAQQQLNKTRAANATIKEAIYFAEETNIPLNIAIANSGKARLSLMQGKLHLAEKWLKAEKVETLEASMLWWVEIPAITRCRVLIASNKNNALKEAIKQLKKYVDFSKSIFNNLRVVELLVLQAVAFVKLKNKSEATKLLNEAVKTVPNDEWIKPFVEAGSEIAPLLIVLKEKKIRVQLIETFLLEIAHSKTKSTNNSEAKKNIQKKFLKENLTLLTQKELDVLLLISKGLSNREISVEMFNSVETIKKHIYNIFQKLQVSNRLMLVTKSKNLGIID
jgi:LuxR family maltose regulon positive regulatory protein